MRTHYCVSTKTIVINILVIGITISSLLLISFHYKSSLLQHRYGQYYDHGPPILPNITFHNNNNSSRSSTSTNNSRMIISPHVAKNTTSSTTTTTTNLTTTIIQQKYSNSDDYPPCFSPQLNSKSWLESKRLGNNNDDDNDNNNNDTSSRFIVDNEYVKSSILNIESLFSSSSSSSSSFNNNSDDVDEINSQNILRHTICAKSSRFLNLKFSSSSTDNDDSADITVNNQATIRYLSLRLLYMSIHVHQHMHAMKEAEYRLNNINNKCENEMKKRNIGKFDFECQDAKFLIVPLKQSGLGAQVRLVMAPALMAGIASDRIVLFVNGSPVGPKFIREPWMLSSCPRKDKQCFFLPDSPCVVTYDEIANATILEKSERRLLFKTGQLPDHIQHNDRVVLMNMAARPQRTPTNFRNRITHIAKEYIINPLLKANPKDPRLPLLFAAVDYILQEDNDNDDSLFYYYGRNFQAHHAMVFFAMRPNFHFAHRIDDIVDRVIFEGGSNNRNNHRTDLALGLPIRASDKCIDESECPSFETYMQLMQSIWNKNEKNLLNVRQGVAMSSNIEEHLLNTSIILTSESSDIFQAQQNMIVREQQQQSNNRSNNLLSFPYKFVTNKYDVLQNTGSPYAMIAAANVTSSKEEILLSTFTSLKMQFYAKYTIGNCCSNHHLLLFDFLKEGCGAAATSTATTGRGRDGDGGDQHVTTCMQDHDDERFRICCGWTKTEKCLAKRSEREALQTKEKQLKSIY
jgi:hypothetical protein